MIKPTLSHQGRLSKSLIGKTAMMFLEEIKPSTEENRQKQNTQNYIKTPKC